MPIQSLVSSLIQGASAALAVAAGGAVSEAGRTHGSNRPPAPKAAEVGNSRFDTADELDLSPEAKQVAVGRLTEEERQQVEQLRQRDREVRSHEQAHLAAAGPHARGGPTYQYVEGPDGQRYAVGGEVSIDTAPVSGDPEATIRKAQVIRAAALAPAEPSAQDRNVAAQATKMEAQARQQLREQQQAERRAAPEGSRPEGLGGSAVYQRISDQDDASVGFYFDAVV